MPENAMPAFPSVEWFQTAADTLNKSDSFKRLGTCDCEMGVQVDDDFYEVDFEAFEVKEVKKIDATRAGALDFTLVQPYDEWKAMIQDIKKNGRATHNFTLNSLDLQSDREFAVGKDYNRRDAFYRFNQTFQEYFDGAANFETTFAK
jgi:putative sterol carrier protein